MKTIDELASIGQSAAGKVVADLSGHCGSAQLIAGAWQAAAAAIRKEVLLEAAGMVAGATFEGANAVRHEKIRDAFANQLREAAEVPHEG